MRRVVVVALDKDPDMPVEAFLALDVLDVLALGEIIYEDFVASDGEPGSEPTADEEGSRN